MSIASLLVLMGLGPWNATTLTLGVLLIVGVFALSVVMYRRRRDRPAPAGLRWILGALALFYAATAAAAAVSGTQYVVAALLASLIPFSAAFLLLATTREKSVLDGDAAVDASAADRDDAAPGTPLGDTPEHSDAERVATPDRRWR
jgi:small-conductance mechanosensitive channel